MNTAASQAERSLSRANVYSSKTLEAREPADKIIQRALVPSTVPLRQEGVTPSVETHSTNSKFFRNERMAANWFTSKRPVQVRRRRARINEKEIEKSMQNMVIKNFQPQKVVVKGLVLLKGK